MYLAIHEAPCVGVVPFTFDADTDAQAEDIAFEVSVDSREFVSGSYDLYRIVWNPVEHKHELAMVVPEDDQFTDVLDSCPCGWTGTVEDRPMDEHGRHRWCPQCGHDPLGNLELKK
jgi:hypothetical protein